ncbi:hypothetical protein KFE25_008264 [Diacronema lutheri]|uniref:Calcineurin-like phosphoesterase domain-containing protein n=1 Tax=Diacronema lutheri TaxID=2081491 RepID=A0A8J5XWS1_DIALT|nr:hypothetical protein KFE25_008264 [Diacronema lutheri]
MAASVRVGVIADVQYADKADDTRGGGRRHYRLSLAKLRAAVRAFNQHEPRLDLVLHLGDIIDGNVSHPATQVDFASVLRAFSRLRPPVAHVIGNHCLDVGRESLLTQLGIAPYYERRLSGEWILLVLDTTDVGVRGASAERVAEAKAFLAKHAGEPNAQPYNGGVGADQLGWLCARLTACRARGARAIVAGHMPLVRAAATADTLAYNGEEVAALLDEFCDVCPLYACGHWHGGGYARRPSGVHHWTCEGMVEAAEQARGYALMLVHADRIEVASPDQAGGVSSRTFELRPPSPSK